MTRELMRDEHAALIASDCLNREGMFLDERDWDRWLELFAEDVVFWVPAWRDEDSETSDPNLEISQIYHPSRRGLAERVMRVSSGKSVTAMPLPRTTHFTSNVIAAEVELGVIAARANWMVQVYQPRTAKQYVNFGHLELRLVEHEAAWLFALKKVHLKNDQIPAVIDFYSL